MGLEVRGVVLDLMLLQVLALSTALCGVLELSPAGRRILIGSFDRTLLRWTDSVPDFISTIPRRHVVHHGHNQYASAATRYRKVECSWPEPADKCQCNGTNVRAGGDWSLGVYKNVGYDQTRYATVMEGLQNASRMVGNAGPADIFLWDQQSSEDSYKDLQRSFCWALMRSDTVCTAAVEQMHGVMAGQSQSYNTFRAYTTQCELGEIESSTFVEQPLIVLTGDHASPSVAAHEYAPHTPPSVDPVSVPVWVSQRRKAGTRTCSRPRTWRRQRRGRRGSSRAPRSTMPTASRRPGCSTAR